MKECKIKIFTVIVSVVVLFSFILILNGCKKSISKDGAITTPSLLIPQDKATMAPSFELQIIANEKEVNNKKSISLNELLKVPSVKAITLHFCMIDDISTGWTYEEVYEQNKSKGLMSLMIIIYHITGVNQLSKEKDAFKKSIHEFINKTNTTMPILWDPNEEVKDLYKVAGSPYIFLIDKSGKIRYSIVGYKGEFGKELMQAIKELIES